jgi:uncharacterized protein YegL
MIRRLPVYLLLDCSESMVGDSLERVEAGVVTMLAALKRNPYALENTYISIITFDARARLVCPLTELLLVKPPRLSIRPGTSLGAALTLLAERIALEVRKTTSEEKGDYRPMVFLLTDGQPTDEWRASLSKVRALKPHVANVIAIGCGDEVDFETLSQIGDSCYSVKDLSTESISKLFVWLTASVQSGSMAPDEPVNLAKIPPDDSMVLIDRDSPPRFTAKNSRLYFHLHCSQTRKPYMFVYRRLEEYNGYACQECVPLPEGFFSDGASKSPPVSVDDLLDTRPCPFCGNDAIVRCAACKNLFCFTGREDDGSVVVCPVCETSQTVGGSSEGFSIDGSSG